MSKNYKFGTSMYIGKCLDGAYSPVFFDPQTALFNNNPPTTLITGAPGSGKSFLALYITALSALNGKQVAAIDPKGDFLPLMNLKDELGGVHLIDIKNTGRPGLLDPFKIADNREDRITLALGLLNIFRGGLTNREETLITPIIEDLLNEKNQSMTRLIEMMRTSNKEDVRLLGSSFDLFSKVKYASLCFAPKNRRVPPMKLQEGLTIFSLYGMDLPLPGETELSKEQKLAVGIMYLLTDFLKNLMGSDISKPKTLVVDEAHIIIASKQGAQILQRIALLGRSRNLSMLLITQNTTHLQNLDIKNTISTRFAFKSTRDEAKTIIADMELPKGENHEERIVELETGSCLMKDFQGNCATVEIEVWRPEWREAFETNPLELSRRKREEEQQRALTGN